MKRSFSRKAESSMLDRVAVPAFFVASAICGYNDAERESVMQGSGGCAPCDAAAAAAANGGIGALATDEKRDLLTYTVLGGVALGALGFVGGYPIAATVGLVSVAGAMLGLALLPTRVEIVKDATTEPPPV